MRLGQLARKYEVSKQEIISFLEEIDPTMGALHSNSKLNDDTEALVAKHFNIIVEGSSEHLEDKSDERSQEIEQNTVESDVVDKEETVEIPESISAESLPEAEVQNVQKEEEVAIETDQLLELLDSEESSIDLSKVTLIKAPKKELDGLKVVGKIDLPEPKTKTEEETEELEKERKADRNSRQRRRLVSDEELEERRLKAKKKKEGYEARQEERRKEKEKKLQKALNKERYQEKLEQAKTNQPKQKTIIETPPVLQEEEVEEERPAPKTLLGKFWRWLNTG